mmetsp:Transcript_16287/g.37671  ORF Transcript_16287/g.37671 Transcript_16287/m.37671 type:complete len:203 (-) Transcript_16287:1580-2188(-)
MRRARHLPPDTPRAVRLRRDLLPLRDGVRRRPSDILDEPDGVGDGLPEHHHQQPTRRRGGVASQPRLRLHHVPVPLRPPPPLGRVGGVHKAAVRLSDERGRIVRPEADLPSKVPEQRHGRVRPAGIPERQEPEGRLREPLPGTDTARRDAHRHDQAGGSAGEEEGLHRQVRRRRRAVRVRKVEVPQTAGGVLREAARRAPRA